MAEATCSTFFVANSFKLAVSCHGDQEEEGFPEDGTVTSMRMDRSDMLADGVLSFSS